MMNRLAETLKEIYFVRFWEGTFINEMFMFESDYLEWLTHPDELFAKKYHYDLFDFIVNGKDANPPKCETLIGIEMQNQRIFMQRLSS